MKQPIRKSAKAKLRTVGGFSVPELLLTMLILLLMTGIMTDGILAVRTAYRTAVDTANAETYLNTVMIALRSKLSLATPVGGAVYSDPELGYYEISNDSDQGIVIQYLDIDMQSRGPQYRYLLLSGADDFISSYGDISYNPGASLFTITNLQVSKKSKEAGEEPETLAEADSYIIHTVNP